MPIKSNLNTQKDNLLEETFDSACAAMNALETFLLDVDNSPFHSRGDYQSLRVVGNRIYE